MHLSADVAAKPELDVLGEGVGGDLVVPLRCTPVYHPSQQAVWRHPGLQQSGTHLSDDGTVAKMGHPFVASCEWAPAILS